DFTITALAQPADLAHRFAHRHRTRVAAPKRYDAKGAAVVAAVLYLHECTRAVFKALNEMRGDLPDGHDIVDDDLSLADARKGIQRVTLPPPRLGAGLLLVAHDQ